MSETQTVKRGSGRPRKPAAGSAEKKPAAESVEKPKPTPKPEPKPVDERIGLPVADPRWTYIGFDDGRGYRCQNGVIVERIS